MKPLTDLINLSFSTGLFPKILKQDKIIPNLKKEINGTATIKDLYHSYQILVKLLKNSSIGSSVGAGSIPTVIFKEFKKLLLKPLTDLINLSFSTGLFPKILKQDKIIPNLKKEINGTATIKDLYHSYQILVKLLKNSSIGSSVGAGSIPTVIFKEFKKLLLKPLTDLINLSFSTGLFPKILKQDKIIPNLKKEINGTATIKDLYHSYQILVKLLKNSSIGSSTDFDQVYSNNRVPTQFNTNQHESTRINTSPTRTNTSVTRVNMNNMSSTRVKMNQHESHTNQHETIRPRRYHSLS